MHSIWAWRTGSAILGGGAGFAYYYYVGCLGGTCPISGNPWISTVYGGVLALLVLPLVRRKQTE